MIPAQGNSLIPQYNQQIKDTQNQFFKDAKSIKQREQAATITVFVIGLLLIVALAIMIGGAAAVGGCIIIRILAEKVTTSRPARPQTKTE